MANNKQRYINTRLWNDSYVSELDPIEKLLFIYFLTNEHTNISGIYEIPNKIIAIETGIDESMLKKILPRLSNKIRYIRGFVVIKNFVKHQNTQSDLTVKGIINCLKDLDEKFLKELVNKGYYCIDDSTMQGVCKGYVRSLNYSNLDLDSNLDSSTDTEEPLKESRKSEKVPKIEYGELKQVLLTEEEFNKLTERFGERNVTSLIFELDTYISSKGAKYKSHYATLLNWANRKYKELAEKSNKGGVAFK